MYHIEKRTYQLILQARSALCISDRDPNAHKPVDCSGYDAESLCRDASFQSTEGHQGAVVEDSLLHEKAVEFWEKIRSRLARYFPLSTLRYHPKRLEVIYAHVRRAIFTDPALMFLIPEL